MIIRVPASISRICFLIILAFGMAGCEEEVPLSLSERVDLAKEARIEGDLRAAILQLKNALREHPDSAAARYLLGQIYIEMENGAAAEKELTQAEALGLDAEALVVPMSRAWLLQLEYQKVLDEVQISINLPASTQAALRVIRGDAYLGLGETARAKESYEAAIKVDPEAALGYVGLGNIALHSGDLKKAWEMHAKAATDVNNLRAITLEGDILSAEGKYAEALKAYEKLVEARPENVLYRTVIAWAQTNVKDYEAANRNVDRVLALVPDYPPANHVKAVIALQTKQYTVARDHANRALAIEPDRMPSVLVLGAASYALGNQEQAYNALRRYVTAYPDDAAGRKLLSQSQIALGRSDEALETLDPLLEDEEGGDAELFGLVAQASLMKGDLVAGRSFLQRSLEAKPDSAAAMAALGRTRIALGEVDEGLAQMEEAVDRKPDDFARRLMLAMEYLRNAKYDKALEAARVLQDLRPKRATGLTVEGIALAMTDDRDGAVKAFRKGLEMEPGNPNASFNLLRYAVADEDWNEVRRLLDGVLAIHPKHKKALLAYAELMRREDKDARAREYLERAVAGNPEALEPTLLLAMDYYSTGEHLKGLEVARKLLPVYPRDPALLELTGRLEMAADQSESAVVTFGQLTEARPGSPVSHFLLALAFERQGNLLAADRSLARVLEIDPAHAGARFARARVMAAKGELEDAEILLRKLAAEHPDEPDYLETQGVIAALRGDNEMAIASLGKALEVRENSLNLRRLAEAYAQAGKTDKAHTLLSGWLKRYPDDFATRFLLANQLLSTGKLEAAEDEYRTLIEARPGSAIALNNLAYLLNTTGRTDQAVVYIERAMSNAPDSVDILDTAGGIYLTAGRTPAAISAYRKAADLAPRNSVLRQRYAEALLADGRVEESREVLKALLNSPFPIEDRDAVEALYLKLTAE